MLISEQQFLALQRQKLINHFDANETVFLERELTQLRAKTFTVQYVAPMARMFIPKANDIASSATTFSYKVFDEKGMAKFISYKSNDIPRVDLSVKEVLGKVRPIAAAYGWDINELREAARMSTSLPEMKAKAAANFIERAIDTILAFGSLPDETGAMPDVGLVGFANNSIVAGLGIIPLSFWTGGAIAAATVMAELNTMVAQIGNDSDNVWEANTLLLPTKQYKYVEQATFSSLTGETILTVFKRNNTQVTLIAPWAKLKTAGATNGPRAIAYMRDASILEAIIPQEFEVFPPEMQGLEIVYNCHARCGGTKIYQPLAVRYGDFATS